MYSSPQIIKSWLIGSGRMETILEEWGFPDLIPIFQEQEIDEEALLCLNDSSLGELIPKMGPRMKFSAKLKQYQALQPSVPLLISIDPSDGVKLNTYSAPDPDETYIELPSPTLSLPNSTSSAEDIIKDHTEKDLHEAFQQATKRKLAFYGEAMLKKACRNVYNLDIKEFLNQTITGKFIINSYSKDGKLTRSLRNKLSYLLISGIMSEQSGRLVPLDLEILAEKICVIFPTETTNTYYIPRIPGTKTTKPVNPKGKLIDKYRNLSRLYNISDTNKDMNNDCEDRSISENVGDGVQMSYIWLKTNQEPWDLVVINWEKTYPLRKLNKSSTVDSFMNEWPILKNREAYLLIQYDFKMLFPNCEVSLLIEYQRWEMFFTKVTNTKPLNRATEEFTSPLTTDISQDSKNAIQIGALPMLLPPSGRIRNCKNHWKPSIIESQESLINLVSTCGNIEEFIAKRRNKLSNLKLTVQPYIIVVGTSFTAVSDSYLVIDNNIYKTSSVLQSLDFAFKAFHALNANYPKESEHIWLIIEKVIYKIESTPITIPAVHTILKDLLEDTV